MNKIFLCLTQVLFLSIFILWLNEKTYWIQLPMFLALCLFAFLKNKSKENLSKITFTICTVIVVAEFLIYIIVLFRTPATPYWWKGFQLPIIILILDGLKKFFEHKDFLKSKVNNLRKKAVNDSNNERINKE